MPTPLERLGTALDGRYRVERLLGQGGTALVFAATDLRQPRTVAVKLLRPELACLIGPGRFLREIAISAQLNHPHILPLFESGEADGLPWFVTPLVKGESLRERLLREPQLPLDEALRITHEIAEALTYAHELGVLHRDIKPENILLGQGHALVADFGIARALDMAGGDRLTETGMAVGTPAYMSPEQAGGADKLDARSDQYSLACVVYEMLAGTPPFVAPTARGVLARHQIDSVPPIRTVRDTVPVHVEAAILAALAKARADRFPSVEAFVESLDGRRPSPSLPYPATHRRRRVAVTAAAMVLGLAAGGLWLTKRDRVPLDPNRVVVAPFANRTGDARHNALAVDPAERLTDLIGTKGITRPVPTTTVRDVLGANANVHPVTPARLSAKTGSGLTVVGTISTRGDSLEYRAQILRQPGGNSIGMIQPVVVVDQQRAAEDLAERLATLLAANRDWGDDMKWGEDFSLAPSLDAYRSFVEAVNIIVAPSWWLVVPRPQEGPKALAAIDAALSRAPGWSHGMVWRGLALQLAGDADGADSAFARLVAAPGIPEGDRTLANQRLAQVRGDWDRNYSLTADLYRMAPKTYAAESCWAALYAVRPGGAPGFWRHVGDTTFWTRAIGPGLQVCTVRALHALGRHQRELEIALAMQTSHPESPQGLRLEIEARAALLQAAEVERLLEKVEGFETSRPTWAASRALIAGRELRAHGDSQAASRAFARAANWHRQRLLRGDTTMARLGELMVVLRDARQWDEIRSLMPLRARLSRTAADSAGTFYELATLEAGTGNRPRALEAIGRYEHLRLPDPRPRFGGHLYAQGLFYTALGDTVSAIAHYREAFAMGELGLRAQWGWHREIDPYILTLPAFQQLVRAPRVH